MDVKKHPVIDKLEKLERKINRKKNTDELREFILLITAIVTANFIHDGLMFIYNNAFK